MPDKFVSIRHLHFFFALAPLFYCFSLLTPDPLPTKSTLTPSTNPPLFMGCEGSLGQNLFSVGDFGSGSQNIPSDNPGIAPVYSYVRQGPPNDGSYVITNYTGAWNGLWASWIRIRDNSTDPNGYMMVVNASFEPGIFYQQKITGLCANTTFEFSADVINLISRATTGHIKPNISFYINDELLFSSGEIPQDETWKTYSFLFTTGPNSTDLDLSIRNNAPGGIGNDLALDNISFRPCGPEAIILPEPETFVCVDEDSLKLSAEIINSSFSENFIQWQVSTDGGATFLDLPGETKDTYTISNFASGVFFYRFLVASTTENLKNFKCRVFSFSKKVTVVPKFFSIADTICSGLVYETGHSSLTQTGIYTDTLISSFGCDSIVTLDLTVVNDPMIEADLTIQDPSCFGIDDASISIDLQQSGFPPYTYTLNDSISGGPLFVPLAPGDYQVEIKDRFGCFYQENISIAYPRALRVDIGNDTMVALGRIYEFQTTTNYQPLIYQWNTPFEVSCMDCPKPTAVATGNGVFTLQVTNEAGCTAVDSLNFTINTADSYQVYAPNAFSPNFDGINDRFNIFSNGLEAERIATFQIYDRWGTLLFDQNNILPNDRSLGWDGRFKNQLVEMGVYIYRVDILFIDGTEKRFTGSVTVVR